MKTQYIVRGYHAFSEVDNFEQGCQGNPKFEFLDPHEWVRAADTLDGLIAKLVEEFGIDGLGNVLLDACDEPGRLDMQAYQMKPFKTAKVGPATYELWKKGGRELWLTDYTFYVEQAISERSLREQVANSSIYAAG